MQAARGLWVDGQRRPVGGGDRVDDREPKAVPVAVAGARGSESLEGLLEAVQLLGSDHGAVVGHRQDGLSCLGRGRDVDATAGQVVRDRVVDQVRHQTLDELRVAFDSGRAERGVQL